MLAQTQERLVGVERTYRKLVNEAVTLRADLRNRVERLREISTERDAFGRRVDEMSRRVESCSRELSAQMSDLKRLRRERDDLKTRLEPLLRLRPPVLQ